MKRRYFLKVIVGGGCAGLAGLLGIPGVATVLSPLLERRRDTLWVRVLPLDDLRPGDVRAVLVDVPRGTWPRTREPRVVYVSRARRGASGAEAVTVFSRSCTDLGCPVLWDPGSRWFLCPCHGGIFSEDGRPQKGPPSRPLYRYATRIRDGAIQIDLRSVPPMV